MMRWEQKSQKEGPSSSIIVTRAMAYVLYFQMKEVRSDDEGQTQATVTVEIRLSKIKF
jgi:hypothetical protein